MSFTLCRCRLRATSPFPPTSSLTSISLPSLPLSSPPLPSFPSRPFSISSDQLRRSPTYPPLPPPTFAPKTLRAQALRRATPYYMSHEEFQRCRRPFPFPVVTKLPLTHRALSPHALLDQLKREEQARLMATYPSHRDPFKTGDRICITKYISLSDRAKVERVVGLVISRHGGVGINAMFTLRGAKLDEPFELQFPLWSPFIVRIDVLEPSVWKHDRNKMFWIRGRDKREWETHLEETLPKIAEQKRRLVKGSPMYLVQEKRDMQAKRRAKEAKHVQEQVAADASAADAQSGQTQDQGNKEVGR